MDLNIKFLRRRVTPLAPPPDAFGLPQMHQQFRIEEAMQGRQSMKFARLVYGIAAAYGFISLIPLYFLIDKVGRDAPPPVSHPESITDSWVLRFSGSWCLCCWRKILFDTAA
jgi:hypothetical protein